MRKTSQDGGDTTSITSGVENEIKKTGAIIKTKRNSIKRKVQSLSHESDDAVIEPLLQKEKEKTDTINQSAKYNLLPKTKTEVKNEKESDKTKLIQEDKSRDSLLSDMRNDVKAIPQILSSKTMPKYTGTEPPLHNHMNTNVFSSPDALKSFITTKSQVLVEIDASKQSGFNPSPLIFTTAKIHTNDKTKHMEPVQVTPVPILSTIEGNIVKYARNNSGEPSGSVTSNVSTMSANIPKSNKLVPEKLQNLTTTTAVTVVTESASKVLDNKEISDKNKLTQSNKALASDVPVNKDFTIGAKLPSNTLKTSYVKDSNYVNNEKKNEIDLKLTKLSLCQDLSSSEQFKGTAPSAIYNSMNIPVTTKNSSVNYATKQIPSDKTAETMKADKANILKTSEPETDLNKNLKAGNSRQSTQSEMFGNKCETIDQDNVGSNRSASIKQLQRQKNAIDKDDTISKLQRSDNSSSSSAPKGVTKANDICTSITKSAIPIQSSVSGVNSANNKITLPKSTANDVHITSPISNKLPSENATLVTSANKTATSNTYTPVKPIVSSHNTLLPKTNTPISKVTDIPTTLTALSSTIAKPLSSPLITSESGVKSFGSNSTSKPHTSIITNRPPTSSVSSANTINVTKVEHPSVTKTNLTTTPSATTSKSIDMSVKSPSVGTDVAKIPSVSTTTAKTLSLPTCTTKSSVSTSSAKIPPAPISDVKKSSLPANSTKAFEVKTTTVSTTVVSNPAILTNTVNASASSKGIAKTSLATTTTTGGTALSTTKNAPSVPVINNASATTSVTSSSILTSTDSTSKTLQSHKRIQEQTNGNKSFNA